MSSNPTQQILILTATLAAGLIIGHSLAEGPPPVLPPPGSSPAAATTNGYTIDRLTIDRPDPARAGARTQQRLYLSPNEGGLIGDVGRTGQWVVTVSGAGGEAKFYGTVPSTE